MSEAVLSQKFRDAAREGQALCLELERGQASTPLADHFAALIEAHLASGFTVAVVSTTDGARADVVNWLLGEDHRVVSTRAVNPTGMVEIYLSEQGYSLETPSGQRVEFASLHAFLSALVGAPEAVAAGADPRAATKYSLAAPPAIQGTTLLVPEALDAQGPPLATSTLIARTHFLLIASPVEQTPTPEHLGTLAHLVQAIGCVQPVATGSATAQVPPAWWREVQSLPNVLLLDPAVLGAEAPPTPFGGATTELRPLLKLLAVSRRLQLAMEALRDRYEQDLRQTQSRRTREERGAKSDVNPLDPAFRRPFDVAKARVQEELTALNKSTIDSSRRSLLPEGGVTAAITEQLQSLRGEDLVQEPGTKMVRLTLSTDFQSHLKRILRKTLKEELGRDLVTLRDGLDALRRDVETQLESAFGAPVSLAVSPPSESDIWTRIGELVAIEIRYKGEMPKRGFLQRLGEGRRAVFAVMMIISLVGSMVGFSWRGLGLIGIAFLIMFIGVVVYTYRAWKREDAEKLDAELDRVREQLQMECKRVATEVQREKQTRLADHTDQIKRGLIARLDDLARERLAQEQEQQGEARDRARDRLRKIDQQLRDLQMLAQRMNKLRQDATSLAADVARVLRDTAVRLGLVRTR